MEKPVSKFEVKRAKRKRTYWTRDFTRIVVCGLWSRFVGGKQIYVSRMPIRDKEVIKLLRFIKGHRFSFQIWPATKKKKPYSSDAYLICEYVKPKEEKPDVNDTRIKGEAT